jgi:hypothetical protein
MLRSVGAGARATVPGHPVVPREWYPYRDQLGQPTGERMKTGMFPVRVSRFGRGSTSLLVGPHVPPNREVRPDQQRE